MVDLDPMEEKDAELLREMLKQHLAYTGSTVAKYLLDDFDNQLAYFVKVFPRDYKKVLAKKTQEEGVEIKIRL